MFASSKQNMLVFHLSFEEASEMVESILGISL